MTLTSDLQGKRVVLLMLASPTPNPSVPDPVLAVQSPPYMFNVFVGGHSDPVSLSVHPNVLGVYGGFWSSRRGAFNFQN